MGYYITTTKNGRRAVVMCGCVFDEDTEEYKLLQLMKRKKGTLDV